MASKEACECCLWVRSDWAASVDAIIATNLFFVSLENSFWVKDLICVFEKSDFPIIILGCIGSHRWRSIDFNEPWTKLIIEQDIKTVEFEAMLVINDDFGN